jgi:WhiB family redox-sensing transcriptional regulator
VTGVHHRDVGSPAWPEQAACAEVGGEWWFPEPHSRVPPAVLRICAGCPVRAHCLAFALSRDVPHGVWAGLTAGEVWSLRDELAAGRRPAEVVAASLALTAARGSAADQAVYYSPAPDRSSPGALPYQARRHRRVSSARETSHHANTWELLDLPEPTAAQLAEAEALLDSVSPAA